MSSEKALGVVLVAVLALLIWQSLLGPRNTAPV